MLTPWILHRTGLGPRFFSRKESGEKKKLLFFDSKPPEK